MTRVPALTPRQVIAALKRAGFFVHHVKGSHYYLKHPDRPEAYVTVAYHSREIYRPLLHSIIKQAGMTTKEFSELL